ncbi:MAG: cytochrome c [Betaproteobacteria bacterium]|jgi:cytochrome c556
MEFTLKISLKLKAVALFATVTLPILSQAQFAKSEDAIKYRKAALTVMSTHFGRIGAVVKGAPYNKDAVASDANIVAMLSTLPWQGFGPGHEGGNALPEVWSNADKFKSNADKLQETTAALKVAANSGDLEAIKKAFGATGQACKGCHDDFRKK